MTEEQLKAKSNAILDKLEESGFDLDDWSIEDAHNNGYIDGYHEGFKDCAKSRLNVTTISDCPIKDEWHYVKDELPSESAMLLLARKTINGVQVLIGYYRSNQFEIFNEKSCVMQNIDSVYAWKEIVLPNESE